MAALEPGGSAWTASANGWVFTVRPLQGTADGPTLLEDRSYQLSVRRPADEPGATVFVGGLPLETWTDGDRIGGIVKTGRTFGRLTVEVRRGRHVLAEATIDVRPRHLDLDTDYLQIRNDLDRVSSSLAYAVWRRTHHQAFPDFEVEQGEPEWLAMLFDGWARIRRALREVSVDPNSQLVTHYEERRAERAGPVDAKGIQWLARNSGAWLASSHPFPVAHLEKDGRYLTPEKLLTRRREVTFDTPANRALKAALGQLESRIRRALLALDHLPAGHFAANDLAAYAGALRTILREAQHHTVHGFLATIPAASPGASTQIHGVRADPRYRQIFRSLEVLTWGVTPEVGGSVTQLSLKDTWELFEFWVYLYVTGLFVEWGWECIRQGALAVPRSGSRLALDLARGTTSTSEFEHRDPVTGAERWASVTFHHTVRSRRANRTLGPGALTIQRDADMLVTASVNGEVRRLILDPKYRAETTEDGTLVCPASGVDAMHVYRDAIGRWEPAAGGARHFVRSIDAAIAVFPSRDEAGAKTSIFYDSVPDGVGALPLLPNGDQGPQLLAAFVASFVS